VADDLGTTRARLALAWVLRQKGVSSAIVGATRPEQMAANLGADEVKLEPAVLERIEAILRRREDG
jgi:aryl-alcohol dehydrogenase-like predicted oxidoreductase